MPAVHSRSPLGVRAVAAPSFFSDTGHEMVPWVLPAFVTTVLGGSAAALGTIDGVADALTGVAKMADGPLAGDPAWALGHVADAVGARLIVVGTRPGGIRNNVRRFFEGSVSVHLAHRQHRPIVVVPLSPVVDGGPLP